MRWDVRGIRQKAEAVVKSFHHQGGLIEISSQETSAGLCMRIAAMRGSQYKDKLINDIRDTTGVRQRDLIMIEAVSGRLIKDFKGIKLRTEAMKEVVSNFIK